jgi:hypothetical protein
MTFMYNHRTQNLTLYFFKEDVKGLNVYNIIIDIYGETKLEQDVGNQLLKWTLNFPLKKWTRTLEKENRAYLTQTSRTQIWTLFYSD